MKQAHERAQSTQASSDTLLSRARGFGALLRTLRNPNLLGLFIGSSKYLAPRSLPAIYPPSSNKGSKTSQQKAGRPPRRFPYSQPAATDRNKNPHRPTIPRTLTQSPPRPFPFRERGKTWKHRKGNPRSLCFIAFPSLSFHFLTVQYCTSQDSTTFRPRSRSRSRPQHSISNGPDRTRPETGLGSERASERASLLRAWMDGWMDGIARYCEWVQTRPDQTRAE